MSERVEGTRTARGVIVGLTLGIVMWAWLLAGLLLVLKAVR